MTDEPLIEGEEQPHLLLVDADATFTRVMARAAAQVRATDPRADVGTQCILAGNRDQIASLP